MKVERFTMEKLSELHGLLSGAQKVGEYYAEKEKTSEKSKRKIDKNNMCIYAIHNRFQKNMIYEIEENTRIVDESREKLLKDKNILSYDLYHDELNKFNQFLKQSIERFDYII